MKENMSGFRFPQQHVSQIDGKFLARSLSDHIEKVEKEADNSMAL